MTKIIGLGTTIQLLDLGADGINHPPALPLVVPKLHAPQKKYHLNSSTYKAVMHVPKKKVPTTIHDLARLEAAAAKRLRKGK